MAENKWLSLLPRSCEYKTQRRLYFINTFYHQFGCKKHWLFLCKVQRELSCATLHNPISLNWSPTWGCFGQPPSDKWIKSKKRRGRKNSRQLPKDTPVSQSSTLTLMVQSQSFTRKINKKNPKKSCFYKVCDMSPKQDIGLYSDCLICFGPLSALLCFCTEYQFLAPISL